MRGILVIGFRDEKMISHVFRPANAPALVELLGGEAGLSPKDALKHLNATIEIGELSEMREALYGDIANKCFFRKHGYDGIVSTYGTDENGHEVKEYVAFELTQIKMRYD